MKRVLLLICMICTVVMMMAQVGVEARIDSIQMLIGQQVHVTVDGYRPSQCQSGVPFV